MATQASTLDQQKAAAVEAGVRAEQELVRLREQRQQLAFDALGNKAGAASAAKALTDLDTRIAELVRQQELAALAVQEADRREREARRQEAEAQRTADAGELERLTAERDERYRVIQTLMTQLAPEVAEAVRLGGEIQNVRTRLGLPFVADRTAGAVFDYLSLKLGPMGVGLRELPTPLPAHRGPLVADEGDRA